MSQGKLGPLSRGQPHSLATLYCYFIFDPKDTGSFVTRLGPQIRPSIQWGLFRQTFNFCCWYLLILITAVLVSSLLTLIRYFPMGVISEMNFETVVRHDKTHVMKPDLKIHVYKIRHTFHENKRRTCKFSLAKFFEHKKGSHNKPMAVWSCI